MNATCTFCNTVYRIDPEKVPSGGIRARCATCDAVFRIAEPAEAAVATPPTAPREPAEPASADPATAEHTLAQQDAGPPNPSVARSTPFGVVDPHQQARRLARALVSDIVVYHPERRERSLAAGTLRADFREEIRKSWDEYVSRVGEPLAKQSTYFREALNDILAGGPGVF